MEHEVYVPFPVGTVRQALTEPERVARCVPGVQLDADAAPGCPEGRLRLRIGSSTITYRGTLTVGAAADDGTGDDGAAAVTVEAKGTEARGDGAVALTLAVRLSPATEPGPGTALRCSGTVHRDGRLAEATDRSAASVGRRLLDRFAENLAADLRRRPVADEAGPADDAGAVDDGGSDDAAAPAGDAQDAAGSRVFDTEVPPPSLDPGSDEDDGETADPDAADEAGEDLDAVEAADAFSAAHPEHAYGDEADRLAPAEAAHARRTMIGRSAEEVDHAPPRGRYAPVPAPESNGTSVTLRWAAPAAAVVLASAVVVGRVLRRRR
ncbi:SRPBCC domain-containing protein [Streptomyces lydicamycinicus]|uniref:Carbon monoxide dehydrogenase subunit G n=1 Tax=Streptomyces lydicamycinicus TaxID=1546107 RepID=A0A0P4R3R3_9ACTN|nr:SRPBCC domain-containing protein [Streptomyces lydicamycinicus]USA02433.1 SRPBCC domain-containing protein [Streptomyces lydicamycinicus]GAO07455.1 carbon monoxide dehydrogenase subunit G [Streptomyces lydicamycinicus]